MCIRDRDGIVYHKTDRPLEPGTDVEGEIDWEKRFSNMQQHSGEHIVSGIVHRKYGYDNVGFHLGDENVTLDFNAVSYTHLDVYKRQEWIAIPKIFEMYNMYIENGDKEALKAAYKSLGMSNASTCVCCGFCARQCPKPVSYTHLDAYGI